mgnify:CR=1 FL=1
MLTFKFCVHKWNNETKNVNESLRQEKSPGVVVKDVVDDFLDAAHLLEFLFWILNDWLKQVDHVGVCDRFYAW